MKHTVIARSSIVAACLAFLLLGASSPAPAQFTPLTGPGSALSVPQAQLIQPDALNQLLQSKTPDKPLLLQVGSHQLFDQAHIPGSIYAGPGSQPSGLQLLQSTVAKVSKKKPIILYCGCCPWNRCPNLAPAYKQLHDAGFTNVKVLYLANNLGADWAARGYPVERTQ
jgi:rhodanese-related sulfurtransferase